MFQCVIIYAVYLMSRTVPVSQNALALAYFMFLRNFAQVFSSSNLFAVYES